VSTQAAGNVKKEGSKKDEGLQEGTGIIFSKGRFGVWVMGYGGNIWGPRAALAGAWVLSNGDTSSKTGITSMRGKRYFYEVEVRGGES